MHNDDGDVDEEDQLKSQLFSQLKSSGVVGNVKVCVHEVARP